MRIARLVLKDARVYKERDHHPTWSPVWDQLLAYALREEMEFKAESDYAEREAMENRLRSMRGGK